MADIRARMRQLIGSASQWSGAGDIVLGNGEIGVEMGGGSIARIKFGNGSSKWSELPYFTGDVSISGTLNYIGVLDATVAPPSMAKGDFGLVDSATPAGAIDPAWGINLNLQPGDQIVFDGTSYGVIRATNSNTTSFVDTIASMVGQPVSNDGKFLIMGHTNAGDMGGGIFYYDPGFDCAANAEKMGVVAYDLNLGIDLGTQRASSGTGALVRVYDGTTGLTPQMAGCFDSSDDFATALEACIEAYKLDVIREEYASSHKVTIPPVDGGYRASRSIVVRRNIIIEGTGTPGRGLGSAKVAFADGLEYGIWFQHPGGNSAHSSYSNVLGAGKWGAGRSQLKNLYLHPENAGGVKVGIFHNVPVDFEYVHCSDGFAEAGFLAAGQSTHTQPDLALPDVDLTGGATTFYGNTNGSLYKRCFALNNKKHGFVAQGNNTQIMTYQGCDASSCDGCGFMDNSSIGNRYLQCHTAQCSLIIEHAGKKYLCIFPHTADATNEPGSGADWEIYWVENATATLSDGTWTSGTKYNASGGVNIVEDSGNYPLIDGHYTEGGIELGVIPRGNTVIVGGVASSGRVHLRNQANMLNVSILNGAQETPHEWRGKDENYEFGMQTGSSNWVPTFFTSGHTDDPDVLSGEPQARGIGFLYTPIRHAYEFFKGTGTAILSFTANGWSKGYFSGKNHVYFPVGLIVGGTKESLHVTEYSWSATPAYKEYSKGTIIWFTDDANETHAIVTTAGSKNTTLAARGGTSGNPLT